MSSVQVCLSKIKTGRFFQHCSFHHISCQTVLDFTQRERRPLQQQPPLRRGSHPYCNWMVALLPSLCSFFHKILSLRTSQTES